jgi:hypothetical protein
MTALGLLMLSVGLADGVQFETIQVAFNYISINSGSPIVYLPIIY